MAFFRRLGFKVVGAFIVLTLTALGVSAYVSVHIAGKGFDRVVHQEFQSTLDFNANFLNSKGANWINWVRHMTIDEREHGLGHTVLNGSRDEVASYITEHLPTAFSGATTVVDANGRVLHRTHLPSEYGDSLGHVGIVKGALRKREINFAIVNELNTFMLYAAAPLVVDEKVVGVLLIGSAVDNTFVEDIKRNTEVELAVVRDRAVMGSTLKDANGLLIGDLPMPYLEYQGLLTHPGRVLETRFLGERYFVAARPIEMMDGTTPGSLFMAVPRQRLDETEADIYATFLGLLGIITALTVIVGAGVSRNLTRPIVHLSEQVDRIAQSGEFEHIQSPSKDETEILADSFNTMQDAIRDKNEELKAYSENLEGLVKARTAELQDAIIAAEEASQSKTRFLASMSHELRTPLNSIIGFSELLSSDDFAPVSSARAKDYGKTIHTSGHHLLHLINEILDLAKIESGRQELKEEVFVFESEIHEAIRMVREQVTRGGITVEVDIKNARPKLCADKLRFKQIIINLLSNAIKFTPPGGRIAIKATHDDTGALHIAVSDTGAGIPEEDLGTVLEAFGQAGSTQARTREGTGLGLPLSKSLMELHGGTLTLESTLGKGTTVHLSFPAQRSTNMVA